MLIEYLTGLRQITPAILKVGANRHKIQRSPKTPNLKGSNGYYSSQNSCVCKCLPLFTCDLVQDLVTQTRCIDTDYFLQRVHPSLGRITPCEQD